MCLVPGPPGVASGGRSYCYDFGKSYHDKSLIPSDFLLMKTIQEMETGHCQRRLVCSGADTMDISTIICQKVVRFTDIQHCQKKKSGL